MRTSCETSLFDISQAPERQNGVEGKRTFDESYWVSRILLEIEHGYGKSPTRFNALWNIIILYGFSNTKIVLHGVSIRFPPSFAPAWSPTCPALAFNKTCKISVYPRTAARCRGVQFTYPAREAEALTWKTTGDQAIHRKTFENKKKNRHGPGRTSWFCCIMF